MARKVMLELTLKEASMISSLIGFVNAGDVSGGPLDDDKPSQRTANRRVLSSLEEKVFKAFGRAC